MGRRRKRTNKKVPAKGRLRDMADKLWSIAVKDDWGWKCAICRSPTNDLNSHHLLPRQHYKLRFKLKNGICLCRTCHRFCPKLSPHQNGLAFNNWLAVHHPSVKTWVDDQIAIGYEFDGTKTAQYYIDVILGLREYVEPESFTRICGVRFSEYLIDNPSEGEHPV